MTPLVRALKYVLEYLRKHTAKVVSSRFWTMPSRQSAPQPSGVQRSAQSVVVGVVGVVVGGSGGGGGISSGGGGGGGGGRGGGANRETGTAAQNPPRAVARKRERSALNSEADGGGRGKAPAQPPPAASHKRSKSINKESAHQSADSSSGRAKRPGKDETTDAKKNSFGGNVPVAVHAVQGRVCKEAGAAKAAKARGKKQSKAAARAAAEDDDEDDDEDDQDDEEATSDQDDAAADDHDGNGVVVGQPAAPGGENLQSFEARVRYVIDRIPHGKVCAYSHVAELAGAPRNAREVGRLLREGLAWPDGAWHRVITAGGKVAVRDAAVRQRRLLEAEGVDFRTSGAVVAGSFWVPTQAELEEFFIGWGR